MTRCIRHRFRSHQKLPLRDRRQARLYGLAPSLWPNPAMANHLPYVRRNGEHNPQANAIPDHANIFKRERAVHALAIGYQLTGKEKYAARARRASHLPHNAPLWSVDRKVECKRMADRRPSGPRKRNRNRLRTGRCRRLGWSRPRASR